VVDPRLLSITKHLTKPIPEPFRATPKAQKSWATLDMNRELHPHSETHIGQITLYPIDRVQVTVIDSAGVTLTVTSGGPHTHKSFRWEDKDWKPFWAKVPKRRKKKAPVGNE